MQFESLHEGSPVEIIQQLKMCHKQQLKGRLVVTNSCNPILKSRQYQTPVFTKTVFTNDI